MCYWGHYTNDSVNTWQQLKSYLLVHQFVFTSIVGHFAEFKEYSMLRVMFMEAKVGDI